MRSSTLCITVALVLTAVENAAAEPNHVLVVQACADQQLGALASSMAAQLARFGSASSQILADAPPCSIDDGSQRQATLRAGRTAFESLEVDRAVQLLATLMSDIEASPRLERDLDTAIEAQMLLAWIASERHDTTQARAYMTAVCALDRGWSPKPEDYPPQAVEQLRRTCAATTANVALRLDVTGRVRVDRQSCEGPCELRVAPGRHFVSAEAGSVRRDAVVSVTAGVPAAVTFALQPTTAEQLRLALRAGELDSLRPLIALQPAPDVVVVDRDETAARAVVGRRPFADLRGPLPLDLHHSGPGIDAVRAELHDLHQRELPPPPPVWHRWWFWTAAGVVGAGAVVGIIAAAHTTSHVEVGAVLP